MSRAFVNPDAEAPGVNEPIDMAALAERHRALIERIEERERETA